jgi:peptidoglycan/xylan/chitin deacetylase (PgdA/CDA1 family)
VTGAPVPILLYHAVSDDPPAWLARWTVTPRQFAAHLDAVVAAECTALTVSELVRATTSGAALPRRPVVITFDDGFADFAAQAAPALTRRGLVSTLYVTTGALRGEGPHVAPGPAARPLRLPPAPMLGWTQLGGLEDLGVEIGAHSHTHAQLDTVSLARAADEVERSRALLEQALGHPVTSFAYPYGYSSAKVRCVVAEQGFSSGAAVRNRFSAAADDPFQLARLTVRSDTPTSTVRAWLTGAEAPRPDHGEALSTRLWRAYRRVRATTVGASKR